MGNKNKHLCPCGSGKRMKVCCREVTRSTKLQMTSSSKLAMRRSAEGLAKAGKHLEACEILEKLVAQSPRNPLIWNDLGVQYEASGQIDKALVALQRGHEVDSTYPPILYNLGKFTLDRLTSLREAGLPAPGLLAEAIGFLNANLDRDPDNADGHHCLALAYRLNQDEPMALAHMTAAIRLRAALEAPPGWRIGIGKERRLLR
jgi:tetratricopeptide (TPR) repeat protein